MSTFHQLVRDNQTFLLSGHENPDGDCLGAQVALSRLLQALGKVPRIVNPDPLGKTFDFLQRHTQFDHCRGEQPLPAFDVAILLDCSTLSRLGGLGTRLRTAGKPIAVVDHHVGSENGDGDACYVDATAAATGALVRRLFREFEVPLDVVAAEGVFLSLVSDTGWFRYSNTDAEVLGMASELVAAGVDVGAIYDSLYRRQHRDSAAVLTSALQRHRFECGGRLAIVPLDKSVMERAVRIDFDTDSVLEPLRSLDGVDIVALLKERFDGTVKLSMRARTDVDVQAICKTFGGGGHKRASGATMHMSLAEAEKAVIAGVARALDGSGVGSR
ncbi:MAG: bifunctional oligoribonuclease/PAP phosphatase NrnA [Planctomycetes bacterium]|nr:bifunctional oligoribonuclease/PAP phosphatase NrnA [Planctomycetota bacterium]